jgi:hypothetical protein
MRVLGGGEPTSHRGELGEHVWARLVHDRRNGVQPEPVESELLHPITCVVEQVAPHGRRAVVQGVTPRRLHVLPEPLVAEDAEVTPRRPEMVVDDVEQHAEPEAMRFVHEGAQLVRRPI